MEMRGLASFVGLCLCCAGAGCGCGDTAGSNAAIYVGGEDPEQRSDLCFMVCEDLCETNIDSPIPVPHVVHARAGIVEYTYLLDGEPVVEEAFTIEDLLGSNVVRHEFTDDGLEYEVVLWGTANCGDDRSVPGPG